jgi:hypothetical protein
MNSLTIHARQRSTGGAYEGGPSIVSHDVV